MLIEASRCLSEAVVRDAADLDLALILGSGFSSTIGGILRWADAVGMETILRTLKKYTQLGRRFEATEQMHELATRRLGFYFR